MGLHAYFQTLSNSKESNIPCGSVHFSFIIRKDPGCPTISVNIGGTYEEKALLDFRASVNLLPYSVYKKLGLGELKPTTIALSLAYRSVKILKGTVDDVLV